MRVQLPLPGLGTAGAAILILPSPQEGAELKHWVWGDGVLLTLPRALQSGRLTWAARLPIVSGR